MSASPNFGYELCVRRISDKDIEGLDLGSWRLAFNGAEPVTPEAVANFCKRFGPYGFRQRSHGTGVRPGGIIGRTCLSAARAGGRSSTGSTGRFLPGPAQAVPVAVQTVAGPGIRRLRTTTAGTSDQDCGSVPAGSSRKDGKASCSSRGRRQPADISGIRTRQRDLFQDDWLDSGDLAYMAGGDVYVTGRIKDIIIRGGRNVYPHELEEAVGNIESSAKDVLRCSAAGTGFRYGTAGYPGRIEEKGSAGHGKAAETDHQYHGRSSWTCRRMKLLSRRPGTVLKTSSGKIRRAGKPRNSMSRSGSANPDGLSGCSSSGWPCPVSFRRCAGFCARSATPCMPGMLGPLSVCWRPPVWLLVVVLPGRRMRWQVTRVAAKLLALLSGTRLLVTGRGKCAAGPAGGHCRQPYELS